jgi:hypothetical protein
MNEEKEITTFGELLGENKKTNKDRKKNKSNNSEQSSFVDTNTLEKLILINKDNNQGIPHNLNTNTFPQLSQHQPQSAQQIQYINQQTNNPYNYAGQQLNPGNVQFLDPNANLYPNQPHGNFDPNQQHASPYQIQQGGNPYQNPPNPNLLQNPPNPNLLQNPTNPNLLQNPQNLNVFFLSFLNI